MSVTSFRRSRSGTTTCTGHRRCSPWRVGVEKALSSPRRRVRSGDLVVDGGERTAQQGLGVAAPATRSITSTSRGMSASETRKGAATTMTGVSIAELRIRLPRCAIRNRRCPRARRVHGGVPVPRRRHGRLRLRSRWPSSATVGSRSPSRRRSLPPALRRLVELAAGWGSLSGTGSWGRAATSAAVDTGLQPCQQVILPR
jgi:hypothetical protein